MKTAKRLLSVLLALVMVAAMVACSGGSDGNTDTNTNSVGGTDGGTDNGTDGGTVGGTDDGGTELPPIFVQKEYNIDDFSGNEYIILQHSPEDTVFGYTEDSFMGSHVMARIEEVEAKFDCTLVFKFIAYGGAEFVTNFQNLENTGVGGDIIFSNNNASVRRVIGTGGEESLLVDLFALDDILNFWDTNKWGNITTRETMMAGSAFYGLTPALWVDCAPLPAYQMVYSRDVLAAFGATDPQEYWENEEWDREAMLSVITSVYDDTGADLIYGMNSNIGNMVRATFLSTGISPIVVESINADESVNWSYGLLTDDCLEAMTWFKNAYNNNKKYFNYGTVEGGGWSEFHLPLMEDRAAFCMTRGGEVVNYVVKDLTNFGLTCWAGIDANTLSGYYENCYSVGIPVFAQDFECSAFLMYDLFEGLNGIETYEDVIQFYRDNYFETDLDVQMLVRQGASLQYSYWPNGGDKLFSFSTKLPGSASISSIIESACNEAKATAENYILPNMVELEKYKQAGYFD